MITGRTCVVRQPKTQSREFGQLALVSLPVAQVKADDIRAPWPRVMRPPLPSSAQAMATNRHITPKPGQGWRVWPETLGLAAAARK
jgi:hypothetical protein